MQLAFDWSATGIHVRQSATRFLFGLWALAIMELNYLTDSSSVVMAIKPSPGRPRLNFRGVSKGINGSIAKTHGTSKPPRQGGSARR